MVEFLGKNLIIKNAKTFLNGKNHDILIENGVIAGFGSYEGDETVDACGKLVTPSFVNIHTHLDKADLLSKMQPHHFGKSLEENRLLLREFKNGYTVNELKARAKKVVWEFIENGVTSIRTQVDVDSSGGLKPIEAMIKLREEIPIDLQICAFPQEGVLNETARNQIEAALELGADLMGGLPLVEKGDDAQLQHIEVLFELAKKYDVDLDVQMDESNDPRQFMLPKLIEATIKNKWVGRVSATHCISLSTQKKKVADETIGELAKAKMNVIVTPSANMITRFSLPENVQSIPSNSITLVKELLDAKVNVAIGTDNIRDIFYPVGNCSMLREMHVALTSTRMTRQDDPKKLFDMASVNGAKIMGVKAGLDFGDPADLIILNGESYAQTLNSAPIIPTVIKNGCIICENNIEVKHG